MPNRLAEETSPYLLQHQNNPVDWYPWGEEALATAKREDRPIFLSIGYSACHWCHVMEHESFENTEIAAQLNDGFISIKVDREERPDLDQIYMHAVQMLTGRGGWPMSVFLTPDLQPFFGGTYWPPAARMGMPGFGQVITAVLDAWTNRRDDLLEQADQLTGHLRSMDVAATNSEIDPGVLKSAEAKLEQAFDFVHGGFGQAPKFPHTMDLQMLLRCWYRDRRDGLLDMVRLNLDRMAAGGIYDHLAGGFARYSVDERWLVPHFEKMLYDNALLADVYLDGFLATGSAKDTRTVRETLDYILTYMTDPSCGFHSTEDADSEGEEGKFYVWTPGEIDEVLGPQRAERFCYVYDVTEGGNFEGQNILNLPKSIEQCARLRRWEADELERELLQSRADLLEVRDRRVRPGKDDKILVSWNALMIHSMSRAGAVLSEPKYLDAAIGATEFLLAKLVKSDGRLLHTWRNGTAKLDAYLDDYAYLINALVTLYESTFDERWIVQADRLAKLLIDHFADEQGGFFFTADDHEQLIARHKDTQDSSVPSGNGMAATALLRLGRLTGNASYLDAATKSVQLGMELMQQAPTAAGQLLIATDMHCGPFYEFVVVEGESEPDNDQMWHAIRRHYVPNHVLACRPMALAEHRASVLDPLFAGKPNDAAEPLLFVCQGFECAKPASGVREIEAVIAELAATKPVT